MDPERAAFLSAINANPQDDAPRLVFADWLDEQDEHAEAETVRYAVKERHEDRVRLAVSEHQEWEHAVRFYDQRGWDSIEQEENEVRILVDVTERLAKLCGTAEPAHLQALRNRLAELEREIELDVTEQEQWAESVEIRPGSRDILMREARERGQRAIEVLSCRLDALEELRS